MKKPTFLLKPSAYKSNKLYAIKPGDGNGDGSVSGYVGNGTRVNKDGLIETVATDTPRVDYLGGAGILLESTRTNQFIQSSAVDGQFTASNVTVTANDTICPDGTLGADKVADVSETLGGYVSKTTTVSDATAIHTVSFFVKFGDRSDCQYWIYSSGASGYNAKMTIESDGTTTIDTDSFGIITNTNSQFYGNGWWRFEATVDMVNTDTGIQLFLFPAGSDVDIQGYAWFWGFQLEQGSFATSYIPTTTTSLQRTYDQINIISTVTNGLIGETNGSLYVHLHHELRDTVDNSGYIVALGGALGYTQIRPNSNGTSAMYTDINSADGTNDLQDITPTRAKVLFNLFGDTTEVWHNGSKVEETSKDMSLTSESLVLRGICGACKIYEVAMWNKTLTDREAQAITS